MPPWLPLDARWSTSSAGSRCSRAAPAWISRIAALSEERIYHEGQVIVTAGDPGKAFYVITNGK